MPASALYEQAGISIAYHDPLVMGGAWLGNINDYTNYSHVISATGGYISANISKAAGIDDLESWLKYGLGRHIVCYNESHTPIWEGFVNNVTVNLGALQVTRGPLMDVMSQVWVSYTPLDTTANPPAKGPKTNTTIAQDVTSQRRYGILERVISGGELIPGRAAQLRDTILADRRNPETTQTVGDPTEPALTLDCLGYYSWLDAVYYLSTTAGTQQVTTKIQSILTAARAINAWCVSPDYRQIATNALLVPNYDNDNKKCGQLINDLVALGDASNSRYTFGIYKNRIAYYQPVPTTFDYQIKALSNGVYVATPQGLEIKPWNVLPARWGLMTDIMVSQSLPATILRADPRTIFIESLTYTAPYGLVLNGGKVSTLPQVLAQYGIGGI